MSGWVGELRWARTVLHTVRFQRQSSAPCDERAVLRTVRLAEEMGIRALLCHAIDQSAKEFYLHHGFVESQIDPLTVMLNVRGSPKPPRF